MNKLGQSVLLLLVFIAALPLVMQFGGTEPAVESEHAALEDTPSIPIPASSGVIEAAFRNRQSNLMVQDAGIVDRILSDDLETPRHQRFIVRLSTGHTILIAHNIDIAPRINDLKPGDSIQFLGQYEWNEKGGTVHWTHHDPSGRHAAGYLYHAGRQYSTLTKPNRAMVLRLSMT